MKPIIPKPFIQIKQLHKSYPTPNGLFPALSNIHLHIFPAEFVAVIGKSGSGKSTLMNVLTGIDRFDSGEIIVGDASINRMNEQELSTWRGKNVGIVFQFFQLLPTLTVAENLMLAMDFCGVIAAPLRRGRAMELLKKFDIAEQADKLPSALSGGQQQRAAIARALANDPPLLVADEPTGNLDSETADSMMHLFAQLAKEGKTIVMVTHERDYADYFSRSIRIADGQLIESAEKIQVRA